MAAQKGRTSDLYSVSEIQDMIDDDGLETAVRSSVNADFIEDTELKNLWNEAKVALDAIEDRMSELEDEGGAGK